VSTPSLLAPYRVLDLTGESGQLCAKILGDLGADVIKVEPPCGDAARRKGPFHRDVPDPNRSLTWWAYNTSKRSLTLSLETADGRALFRRLTQRADVVVESFMPGELERLGLSYDALHALRPEIIVTSITPFGQQGPRSRQAANDLTCMAAGGLMAITGDDDRAPVRMGGSQSYSLAGAQAAAGTLVALWSRRVHGTGQHVDVSIQEAVMAALTAVVPQWFVGGQNSKRGERAALGPITVRDIYPCRGGHVAWRLWMGPSRGRRNAGLLQWMVEEGEAEGLSEVDWEAVRSDLAGTEQIERWESLFARFFATRTKRELYEQALQRRIFLWPVYTVADLLADPQLAYRGYFVGVDHPELGSSVTYPGAFFRSTVADPAVHRRPPLLGEHTAEILQGELGLSASDLIVLREAGVV
jgi:crotonobetainyl-CoA:carnitine CoA-transferase CaiB-like acyl-CoA transferase